MGQQRTEAFKKEAVRIALTSGLSRKQVAADLGIGFSTLGKWIRTYRCEGEGSSAATDTDLLQEVERLRRENRVLKEERDVLN